MFLLNLGIPLGPKAEKTYTHTGFTNWNDIVRNLSKHEKSHQSVADAMTARLNKPSIAAHLNRRHRQEQLEKNEQLVYVIKSLRLLSRQNIALRGSTYKKVCS